MAAEVKFEIRKLYLKDASLESPQSPEVFLQLDSSPDINIDLNIEQRELCLLYTSPSPRDQRGSRMPSSA